MSSKVKLFPHQVEALDLVDDVNKVAFYLDMGLGKTYVGSEKADNLGNKVLLICQKSKIDDWVEHYNDNYDYDVYNLRNKDELLKFINTSEVKSVGIVNYELVFRRSELKSLRNFTIMLDESSYIKNPKAKRTKFIMSLKYENVILLSGTPMGGGYEELFTQMQMLGSKITKSKFYDKYVKTYNMNVNGWKVPIITGYKNIDDLKSTIRSLGAVFMETDDVMDLPEQIDIPTNVSSTVAYRRYVKEDYILMNGKGMKGKLKLNLPDEIELVGDTVLKTMLNQRKLSSYLNENKVEKVTDILNSTNKRVIIFYNFKNEFKQLWEICSSLDRPIAYVNGDGRDLEAYDKYSNSVVLIQYQSGSQGLNLQKANITIYYSPTQSAEYFMQSKKRTHRIKQEETCYYYYLKTKGSIEEKIYNALERGEDYTSYLFEGGA